MADEQPERDEESQTEEASPRRLEQAWEAGNIPFGRDAVSAVVVLAGVSTVLVLAPALRDAFVSVLTNVLGSVDHPGFGEAFEEGNRIIRLMVTVCGAAALAALAASLIQTRLGFWPDRIVPDLTRAVHAPRALKLFTREGLADLGFSLLKVVTVGTVLWFATKNDLLAFGALFDTPPEELLRAAFHPLVSVVFKVIAAIVALAALDLFLNHRRFNARMRMSKTELKREHKEEDGDPRLRAARRRKHRQLARRRIVTEVPKADAVVVNPTHIAIAIRYRRNEGGAPRVVAKGKGQLAETIRELARANGIPIIEDIPLARLLYRRVKVGGQVPAETYKAVAAVLAFVYRLTGRKTSSSSR